MEKWNWISFDHDGVQRDLLVNTHNPEEFITQNPALGVGTILGSFNNYKTGEKVFMALAPQDGGRYNLPGITLSKE